MDAAASGDWRALLQPEARLRIVNKIMDTLKRQFPVAGPENLDELRKIAMRFEEKTFATAINQSDYLRRISMKMLTMKSRTQNPGITNQMPSNPANQNPPDPGSHVLQSQLRNTGQSLPIPLPNQPQACQNVLAQGLQNNIACASVQGSVTLASAVSSVNGLNQSNMSSIGVNNSGQGIQQNIYANSQRQIQGRPQQQPMIYQKTHQQSLNPHLYAQQFQLQHLCVKAKLSHPSLLQSQVRQQQQQQQPLLSAIQMQSSQRPLMQMSSSLQASQSSLQQTQPPVMQSVMHSEHQQNQPNLLQQFPSPLLQQHPQSVLRQQQPSQTSAIHQQASILQQQPAPLPQQPALRQQQQQLLGHRSNITNMQQNQLLGRQNIIPDGQHQQCSLSGQQNNLMNMQTKQQMNMSLHQQVAPQGSMSGLQQLESQQQMQQLSHQLGSQTISNMQQFQQAMHMMQPQKTIAQPKSQQQQQSQQAATALMQSQGEQPQPNPSQVQLMSQIQNQTVQLQQKLPTQQQPSPLQSEMQPMQQRLHVSGGLCPSQNAIEQQKQPHQSQRGLPEASASQSNALQYLLFLSLSLLLVMLFFCNSF